MQFSSFLLSDVTFQFYGSSYTCLLPTWEYSKQNARDDHLFAHTTFAGKIVSTSDYHKFKSNCPVLSTTLMQ